MEEAESTTLRTFRTNKSGGRHSQKGMETLVGDHACAFGDILSAQLASQEEDTTDAKRQTKSGGLGKVPTFRGSSFLMDWRRTILWFGLRRRSSVQVLGSKCSCMHFQRPIDETVINQPVSLLVVYYTLHFRERGAYPQPTLLTSC